MSHDVYERRNPDEREYAAAIEKTRAAVHLRRLLVAHEGALAPHAPHSTTPRPNRPPPAPPRERRTA